MSLTQGWLRRVAGLRNCISDKFHMMLVLLVQDPALRAIDFIQHC